MLSELGKIHNFPQINTIIVDKDMNKISALRQIISSAAIKLCKCHVMQALTRDIKKFPVDHTKSFLTTLTRGMVYSNRRQPSPRSWTMCT